MTQNIEKYLRYPRNINKYDPNEAGRIIQIILFYIEYEKLRRHGEMKAWGKGSNFQLQLESQTVIQHGNDLYMSLILTVSQQI